MGICRKNRGNNRGNMKVLNLYAGIGGNRKLWGGVEVTAVELNPDIAAIYKDFYPDDKIVIGDAHNYLLENYNEYDFIWSSPPCQTHSQIRYNLGFKNRGTKAVYPDMKLYEEILFLQWYFKGNYVVENTRGFYDPLIPPRFIGSHYFWSNFYVEDIKTENRNHRDGTVESLQQRKQIDLSGYDIKNKRQILRNCVEPELGLHIFNQLKGIKLDVEQQDLFNS